MKTTPEERALLRAHAVKGSKAPRTTATFTADAILRLLDDVDELEGTLKWFLEEDRGISLDEAVSRFHEHVGFIEPKSNS